MQDFHKLDVYNDAVALSIEIFENIRGWKDYRVKEQLCGAITSIFANLAEMCAYDNKNQQIQKITICLGEANEAESWLSFCEKTNLITSEQYQKWINQLIAIRKQLFGLLRRVREDIVKNKVVRYETDKSGFAYAKS